MKKFTTFASVGIPIDIANCDTDQIIPARFLRRAKDDPDYPAFLLHDLRFDADGNETDFIYNRTPYRDGQILVADLNWGCGSSRENAVTVLVANGIRSVIAPSFGDIHYNNCIKNGVLPVRLPSATCDHIRHELHAAPGAEIMIDLTSQSVTGPNQSVYSFDIEAFDKLRLLDGLDDISLTLQHAGAIDEFERDYRDQYQWIF
jgi:3-isopropylmalate/(R)-2-methylmalate dehydratase small subunit